MGVGGNIYLIYLNNKINLNIIDSYKNMEVVSHRAKHIGWWYDEEKSDAEIIILM